MIDHLGNCASCGRELRLESMWKANQTFDTEFLNHIDTYCDQLLFDYEKQNWDKVEREVHRDFDAQFGVKEVSRHLAEFKRPFVK